MQRESWSEKAQQASLGGMREPVNPSRPHASKKESALQQQPTELSGTLCPEDSAKRISPTSGVTNSSNAATRNRRPGPTPLCLRDRTLSVEANHDSLELGSSLSRKSKGYLWIDSYICFV